MPTGLAYCQPDTCPCEFGECTLSRYTRALAATADSTAALHDTEAAVSEHLQGLNVDIDAMAGVSNIYRAAGSIRNYFEREVLTRHDLTWTGWVVLWVVWIWGDIETRHVAAEAGISKGTLTGVANTLEARGLVKRTTHPDDARRMLLSLTDAGRALMDVVLPELNVAERFVLSGLTHDEELALVRALRKVVLQLEAIDPADLGAVRPHR